MLASGIRVHVSYWTPSRWVVLAGARTSEVGERHDHPSNQDDYYISLRFADGTVGQYAPSAVRLIRGPEIKAVTVG